MHDLIPVGCMLLGMALGAIAAFVCMRQVQQGARAMCEVDLVRRYERIQGQRDAEDDRLKADLDSREKQIECLLVNLTELKRIESQRRRENTADGWFGNEPN